MIIVVEILSVLVEVLSMDVALIIEGENAKNIHTSMHVCM